MRYLRVVTTDDGGSRMFDEDFATFERPIADGVPPMLVSDPIPLRELHVVTHPRGPEDWEPHVAPRRQWIVILAGAAFIQTTDGERRELHPGDVLLVEDTTGRGHVSGPITDDFAMAFLVP